MAIFGELINFSADEVRECTHNPKQFYLVV